MQVLPAARQDKFVQWLAELLAVSVARKVRENQIQPAVDRADRRLQLYRAAGEKLRQIAK
jgi:hypothetical protein